VKHSNHIPAQILENNQSGSFFLELCEISAILSAFYGPDKKHMRISAGLRRFTESFTAPGLSRLRI
jgi:hypothetical protein